MNINHIWSVVCKESLINQGDNLISLLNVLEELIVDVDLQKFNDLKPDKIKLPINYEVVSLWNKENKNKPINAELKYELLDPNGEEVLNTKQDINFGKDIYRFRSRMKISGFPVSVSGEYQLKVKIKEDGQKEFKLASTLPIEVKMSLLSP